MIWTYCKIAVSSPKGLLSVASIITLTVLPDSNSSAEFRDSRAMVISTDIKLKLDDKSAGITDTTR